MSLQHFIIRGKHLGSVDRKPIFVHEKVQQPWGEAFFCPICSELWAVCPVEGRESSVYRRACDRHPVQYRHDSNGLLNLPWDSTFSDNFPPAVIRYELLQEFRHAEELGILPPVTKEA